MLMPELLSVGIIIILRGLSIRPFAANAIIIACISSARAVGKPREAVRAVNMCNECCHHL